MKELITMILAATPIGIVAQDANESYALPEDVFNSLVAEVSAPQGANYNRTNFESRPSGLLSELTNEVNDGLLADPDFDVQEDMISYTKDQKTVFFSANRKLKVKKGDERVASLRKSVQLHLFKADVTKHGEWINLEMLPFNSLKHSTGHPALNEDDSKLYFVSDGPGSMGKTDIFVVDLREDGTYGEPENLGSKINSYQREVYPYIDEESVLYFASDKLTEGETLDIFATRIVDDEPGIPVKLDVLVSSSREEYAAAFRTLDSDSFRWADESPEMDLKTPAADDRRDLEILSEAERLAEIENSERPVTTSDMDQGYDFDSDRTVYTVQIGAFLDHVNKGVYRDVPDSFSHSYEDGYNRFYSGLFESEGEARAHLKQMREEGFGDAFIIGLKGKSRFFPE
jgi:hypothetical protein